MDPSFPTRLVAPSWKTSRNCIPADPRSSWYSSAQHASEIDTKFNTCYHGLNQNRVFLRGPFSHHFLCGISEKEEERMSGGSWLVRPFYVNRHKGWKFVKSL